MTSPDQHLRSFLEDPKWVERQRAEFEAWRSTKAFPALSRDLDGDYVSEETQFRWHTWLAARALSEAEAQQKAARIGELEGENARLRKEASRDWLAAWHVGPEAAEGHADLLDMVAGEIDCGQRCEHGFTEHDTGSFVCRKNDDGECGAANAALLGEIASAFRTVAARKALGGSHE